MIKLVIVVAIGDFVEARRDFIFVIIDADIQCTVYPRHAIYGPDRCFDFFNILGRKRLAASRRRHAIKAPELITDDQAASVVRTEIDPRAL